ncbi:MAG: hypothetical protein MI924_38280 [Chloroflexales bacterium]|nr:hypothetical protein [Chloroflexales bacterium]
MARQLADEALQLAEVHQIDDYHYHWILYERGLLEQRAGNFAHALQLLQQARTHCEHAAERNGTVSPIWRWIVAAEGHTLRDQGDLSAADACYQRSGWGEGEDGPLMLWLLQERWNEASCAAEARLTAAHASHATFESANLNVFVALLQSFQFGSTATIHETLHQAADAFAALGFHYHRASVLLHLAAVEYDLNLPDAGDATLAEALRFGHMTGYYNFAWWHQQRMRNLLARALARSIEEAYCQQLAAVRNIWSLDSASTMLSIRCLGQFELQINNQPIPLARWQGHAAGIIRMQRLLLYLARHRQEQSINAIARYVWADRWNCIDSSANVHLTINGLRRVLEPHITQGSHSRFVLRGAFGYQLAPEIRVAIDLDVFAAQIALARKHEVFGQSDGVRGAYLQAEQVYGGDFALAKPSPDELEQYRTAYCEAVRWLATDDLGHERYAQCVRRAKRLLGEDPADQIASELLIEAAVALGEQQVARRAYERAIRAGVGVSPRIAALVRTKSR